MSFAKILSGTQLECQTFWMQTRNDFQLVLILVLTVCKVISRRHCLSDKMLFTVNKGLSTHFCTVTKVTVLQYKMQVVP